MQSRLITQSTTRPVPSSHQTHVMSMGTWIILTTVCFALGAIAYRQYRIAALRRRVRILERIWQLKPIKEMH
jgi:hypothetical protein